MEIYLNTDNKTFRLPILPENFENSTSAELETETVQGLGKVSIYKSKSLSSISLESFFPNKEYPFIQYRPLPGPYDCVNYLNDCMKNGTPVRLIITGKINQLMLIESFNYGERDGTGDVYFSIDLIEYKSIEIPRIQAPTPNPGTNTPAPTPPPVVATRTYKVVKGDCLWNIAKKYYGKGSLYPKIKDANSDKYPSLKKNNIIYPNWVFVIP